MNKNTVALCCDSVFLPFAAFLADQIARLNPERDFDINICSSEPLVLPEALTTQGIRFYHLEVGEELGDLKTSHLPHSTYLRLWLADALGRDYGRILYLDADMFIEGGTLAPLFKLDMQGRCVAAVRDMQQWLRPRKHIRDFRVAGLPAAPYFNGGLELFDTKAFISAGVLQQCLDFAAAKPEALFHHDQSVLNCVLHRNWTEISPVWNWQWAGKRPMWSLHEPILIGHYAGHLKPWNDARGICPPRYFSTIAPFLERHFPERYNSSKFGAPELRSQTKFLTMAFEHLLIQPRMFRYLDRFNSPQHSIAVD